MFRTAIARIARPNFVVRRQAARKYSSDGSVREAGGSFKKREAAAEEKYFRKQDAEKIAHLKEELSHKKPAPGKNNTKKPEKESVDKSKK
ncbi:mitochondrial ATPase inhibitor, IATP-domain-containing protein [Paraphysoderma sedebokerense]|nr:mitochondrial ATPase inhibitor, IATP-domain-containing protein [Paraphysoderma sedebokerense]